jgi:Rod binding domain-containing protein
MNIAHSISDASAMTGAITAQRRVAAIGAQMPVPTSPFQATLSQVQDADHRIQMRAKIRDVAEKYVAQSLVQPLLKQARELRDDTPPFGTTQAEKQFGGMLDERTSLDMVKRGHWGLVGSIETRLLRAAGLEKSPVVNFTPVTEGATR